MGVVAEVEVLEEASEEREEPSLPRPGCLDSLVAGAPPFSFNSQSNASVDVNVYRYFSFLERILEYVLSKTRTNVPGVGHLKICTMAERWESYRVNGTISLVEALPASGRKVTVKPMSLTNVVNSYTTDSALDDTGILTSLVWLAGTLRSTKGWSANTVRAASLLENVDTPPSLLLAQS